MQTLEQRKDEQYLLKGVRQAKSKARNMTAQSLLGNMQRRSGCHMPCSSCAQLNLLSFGRPFVGLNRRQKHIPCTLAKDPLQALLRAGCCKLWIGKAGGLVAVDSVEKMHVVVEELLNERCFGMSTTLGSWQARHGRFAMASGLGRTNTE